MAQDFPNSPTVGQTFAGPNGTFTWDGGKWVPNPSATSFLPLSGGNMTGPVTVNGGVGIYAVSSAAGPVWYTTGITASADL